MLPGAVAVARLQQQEQRGNRRLGVFTVLGTRCRTIATDARRETQNGGRLRCGGSGNAGEWGTGK